MNFSFLEWIIVLLPLFSAIVLLLAFYYDDLVKVLEIIRGGQR